MEGHRYRRSYGAAGRWRARGASKAPPAPGARGVWGGNVLGGGIDPGPKRGGRGGGGPAGNQRPAGRRVTGGCGSTRFGRVESSPVRAILAVDVSPGVIPVRVAPRDEHGCRGVAESDEERLVKL